MRTCGKCLEEKEDHDFSKSSRRKDGLQLWCRGCKSSAQDTWYSLNRESHKKNCALIRTRIRQANRQFLWDYLSAHTCVDCGESDPPVLQFDHVRGQKKKAISQMLCFSLEKIQEEIRKCEVRCANCHARKTARDQSWYKNVRKGQ